MPSVIGLKREILYLQGRTLEFTDGEGGGGYQGRTQKSCGTEGPSFRQANNYLEKYEDFSCLERDCYLS